MFWEEQTDVGLNPSWVSSYIALTSYLISASLGFLICTVGKLYQLQLTICNLSAPSQFWGHQPPQLCLTLLLQAGVGM